MFIPRRRRLECALARNPSGRRIRGSQGELRAEPERDSGEDGRRAAMASPRPTPAEPDVYERRARGRLSPRPRCRRMIVRPGFVWHALAYGFFPAPTEGAHLNLSRDAPAGDGQRGGLRGKRRLSRSDTQPGSAQ